MLTQAANWNAPDNITAFTTTRLGGCSQAPYNSNNLALHVEDEASDVYKNRQQLVELMRIPAEPVWLNQTHSTRCVIVEEDSNRDADAAITRGVNQPLVIMTADCLPILLCSETGAEIAAIHAGWRGLCQGIVENTLNKMTSKPESLIAWVGPAICGACYEIGNEVFEAFTAKNAETQAGFQAKEGKWLANLPLIAQISLNALGINKVFQSNLCTFEQEDLFFSYRKRPQTGRIATLIWLRG